MWLPIQEQEWDGLVKLKQGLGMTLGIPLHRLPAASHLVSMPRWAQDGRDLLCNGSEPQKIKKKLLLVYLVTENSHVLFETWIG